MRKSIVAVLGPTAPCHDLTTVEAVNAALGIDGNTADDGVLADQITRVSLMIAALCDRGSGKNKTFAALEVMESFQLDYNDQAARLNLAHYPVVSIDSISIGGAALDAANFGIDLDAGLLYCRSGYFSGEIVAEYIGGYDLPDEAPVLLAQACLETIRSQRANAARDPAVRQVQHGETSITYSDYYNRFGIGGAGSTILPPNVNDMIQPYKRYAV